MLLCDTTIRDAANGKLSVIGIFRQFLLPEIPGSTSTFSAFVQITNACGKYQIVVEVRDLNADEVIARAVGPTIAVGDRLHVWNIVIPTPPLPIEHEGPFDFIVIANDEEIDRQQIRALLNLPKEDGESSTQEMSDD